MKISVFKIIKNESFNGYYQTKNNNNNFFYLQSEGKIVLLKDCFLDLEDRQCQLFLDFVDLNSEIFVKLFHSNKNKTLSQFNFQDFLKTLKSNLIHYLTNKQLNKINFDYYKINFQEP